MALLRLLAFLLALGLRPSCVASKSDWDYEREGHHGPSHWSGLCHSGSRQSPIDIVPKHTAPVRFDALRLNDYVHSLSANDATLYNNGHSVALEIGRLRNASTPSARGGGLEAVYVLDHVHFHAPSEHTFSGRRYPLEAHLVHRDSRSPSVAEAAKTRDGIAVLGVLFKLSDEPNPMLRDLTEALMRLGDDEGRRVRLAAGGMTLEAFLPQRTEGFFRYYGSLTTPGCQESVVWTVFQETIPISEEQLKQFRMPESNYRPSQSINRRFVLHNGAGICSEEKSEQSTGAAASSRSPPLSSILLLLLLLLGALPR